MASGRVGMACLSPEKRQLEPELEPEPDWELSPRQSPLVDHVRDELRAVQPAEERLLLMEALEAVAQLQQDPLEAARSLHSQKEVTSPPEPARHEMDAGEWLTAHGAEDIKDAVVEFGAGTLYDPW
jgi:hypothetical protein